MRSNAQLYQNLTRLGGSAPAAPPIGDRPVRIDSGRVADCPSDEATSPGMKLRPGLY